MSVDKNNLKDVTKETYKRKLADLPNETLKDIEGAVFTLYYHHQKKYEATELGGHNLQTLLKLGRIIPEIDKHHAIYSKIEEEWQIWDSETDTVHIKNAERLLSVMHAALDDTESVMKLKKKKNGLYVSVEDDKRDYFISEKLDTGKAILVTALFKPRLGTMKTTDSVYEKMNNDSQKTLKEKELYLKDHIKEINRGLRETKAPFKFKLQVADKSVFLVVKSGSS